MIGAEEQRVDLVAALDRQQRIFQDAASFLAVVRGPDHRYEFANEAYGQLISGRSFLGRRFCDVLPEAATNGVLAILDTVYRSGERYGAKDFQSELRGLHSGEVHTVVVNFQFLPARDLEGNVSGVYIEGTDVTERLQNEAALEYLRLYTEQRRVELESIYENMPIGLALIGADRFEFRRVNKVQADFYDLSPEQLVGKTIRETSPNVADTCEVLLRKAVAGETVRDVELRGELPQRPGETRSWLISYAPIWLEGRVDAMICTALETTELRRAERVALQNEKLAAVGRLAASIAHEINNPLEAVTNLLYLIKHSDSLEHSRELIELADAELRRVSAITTQTLGFHRQTTEPRAVSCDDLLGSALAIFQGRLTSAGVPVLKRKRAHQPVLCFHGEIRQVLNNLVGNATDALTGHGGTLFLRSREGTDWRTGRHGLWLTVADSGTGMSPETKRRAFEAFFSTKGIGGTGLGLWISRDIIARHEGRMLVRSSQRQGRSGTVMGLFLPFEAVRRLAPSPAPVP